jgi:hypothetical protein
MQDFKQAKQLSFTDSVALAFMFVLASRSILLILWFALLVAFPAITVLVTGIIGSVIWWNTPVTN